MGGAGVAAAFLAFFEAFDGDFTAFCIVENEKRKSLQKLMILQGTTAHVTYARSKPLTVCTVHVNSQPHHAKLTTHPEAKGTSRPIHK